jgi:hypothetical protein
MKEASILVQCGLELMIKENLLAYIYITTTAQGHSDVRAWLGRKAMYLAPVINYVLKPLGAEKL